MQPVSGTNLDPNQTTAIALSPNAALLYPHHANGENYNLYPSHHNNNGGNNSNTISASRAQLIFANTSGSPSNAQQQNITIHNSNSNFDLN